MKLLNRWVLVTGGAKRIGRELCLSLAKAGAHVGIHFNRSDREAKRLAETIRKKFARKVLLIQADLAQVGETKRLAQEMWEKTKGVDVLINNASTFYPTPLGKVKESQWEDLFNVNVRAPFFLSEFIGLQMKKRGWGKIINIADWSALRPYMQYVPYCASKAALVAVSQGMAKSLAPQVQVNTILPGPVMWPEDLGDQVKRKVLRKTPLGRIGSPQDISEAVQFFIQGDFMTGALLHVDGGRSIV